VGRARSGERPGGGARAAGRAAAEPELDQLLAHAHVYRLVTEVAFRRGDLSSLEAVARTSQPVTVLLMKRLAAGRIKAPPASA
jgi:hypothetical protein